MPGKQLLYIQREGAEAGPYDLVQMAGLLRKNIISRETQTRLDGDDAWMPLSWQPQFAVIRELSPDATSMHLDELNEDAMNRRSPIPLPSGEFLFQLVAFAVGCGMLASGAFVIAWMNVMAGTAVLYVGLGIALAASVMIILRMMDEDYLKLALIFFIPLYDIYYLICNFEKYAILVAVRYAAISVALGATCGLAMHG
jgi:hypothetical protein